MSRRFRMSSLAAFTAAALVSVSPARALEGVVTSIKPVHSLVSAVMDGVAAPTLLVRGAGSAHTYSLRPSDARALEEAPLVFWVGPGLETFLRGPLDTLASGARVVALADAPELELLEFRDGGPFEGHGDAEEGHEHTHEHAHEHDESPDHGHDHAHAHGNDLHVWLDTVNARALVAEIAARLSETDPANAERYRENALAYSAKLDTLTKEIAQQLASVQDKPAIVFHDAYQYFERRFGINVVGSITVSPDVMPGAQRVSEIRAKVRELGAACIFSEPQFEPRLIAVVAEGTGARVGVLDPLGADLEDGPELYLELIRTMARSLRACLSAAG